MTTDVHRSEDWQSVAQQWAALAQACGASFFQSAEWVGVWLETFGALLDTRILVFHSGSETVGACLVTERRAGPSFLPLSRVSLNAAGESAAETTYIEYNDLLALPEFLPAVAAALARFLKRQEWEELALDGFVDGPGYRALRAQFSGLELSEVRQPSYYVDLAAIRREDGDFEGALKSHFRKHLRQNIRYCSQSGPLELTQAADSATGLAMLREIAMLSQIRNAAVGRCGVFGSPRFVAFHERMVEKYLGSGLVQLLKVTAGGQTLGIVYNLIQHGKVYFYQGGFRYTEDRRLSPGLVTLSFAIRHCLELGLDDFDFLSGDAHYKKSMSTGSRELIWAVLRRKTFRTRLVGGLKDLRDRVMER
jgi:CelD/BcsL family acetyltransferase involved in cellulose biosynthesis